jgi:Uma2 family endonuclease
MSSARKYSPHYLVADYQQWEGDWELWFGTAVAMAPSPFGPHERAVSQLSFQIQSSIKSNFDKCNACQVYTGLDWIVQFDTVVRPDVMLVCGDQPEKYLERAPSIVIEILSEATAEKDRTVKRDLYESQGVEHYLIVDLIAKAIQWLAMSESGTFNDWTDRIAEDGKFSIVLSNQCRINFDRESTFVV